MAKVLQLASGAHLEFRPATPEEVEDWSSFYRKKNPKAQSEPKFEVLVWTPSPAMKDEVPEGFTFEMVCLHLPSGKRFFPFYPGEDMLRNAFTAGMAILISGQKLTPEQRSDMRIALLLYDRLASTRAKFNNSLERSRSLILTKCLRDIEAATDILPDHLGLDNQGESKKWSISKLLQKGREEAEKRGLQKIQEKELISLGLLAAARLAPFEAKVEQAESLLRLFLFEVPDGPGVSQETLEQVYKRLAPALEKHLEDEPEKFEGWFQGPKSSLLTGLAKQKKAPGGPMDRQMVARAARPGLESNPRLVSGGPGPDGGYSPWVERIRSNQ